MCNHFQGKHYFQKRLADVTPGCSSSKSSSACDGYATNVFEDREHLKLLLFNNALVRTAGHYAMLALSDVLALVINLGQRAEVASGPVLSRSEHRIDSGPRHAFRDREVGGSNPPSPSLLYG